MHCLIDRFLGITRRESIKKSRTEALFYFFYRIYILNIYLYALHCYYTLRNSNKKTVLMKLYKNKKNPNRGNSL
ncbi:hypothetical protein CN358_22080 [Bacillus thuringiensis]|nr:hypothetical protein CN358_22080 [Bacillus thuringiensis]